MNETKSRLDEVQVSDGPHVLRVKTLGGGEVRLLGQDLNALKGRAREQLFTRIDPLMRSIITLFAS